jgi:hypothetical protein
MITRFGFARDGGFDGMALLASSRVTANCFAVPQATRTPPPPFSGGRQIPGVRVVHWQRRIGRTRGTDHLDRVFIWIGREPAFKGGNSLRPRIIGLERPR